ncbi:hypothetical protein HF984_11150 [Rothia terrae]|uniref:hypothetical protein n=1 Tax=Rothia terrae TaxID=396015 RepID=UPI001446F818|nr:hypothetical protein [Rothia terrae]NKZ35291.1 hypothetical protein [Rothia terrae]
MSRIAKHTSYTQLHVLKTIPEHHRIPRNIVIWRNRVFTSTYYENLPAGKQKRFTAFINALLPYHQPQKHYIQITREHLATIIGCSLKTISRYFKDLKEHGLLTLVAPGRSREKSPLNINEAPVYAPCVPLEDHQAVVPAAGVEVVDSQIFVHPFVKELKELNPLNAREEKAALPLPPKVKDSKKKPKIEPLGIYESVIAPEGTKKAQKALELRAAATLRERVIALRGVSLPRIAFICRRYFVAGWCVKDILNALEVSADGQQYTTNGADGMRSKIAWLVIRLRNWLSIEGAPVESLTQHREVARRVELERRAAERAAEVAARKKARPMPVGVKRQLDFLKLKAALGMEAAVKKYPEFAC